MLLKLGSPN